MSNLVTALVALTFSGGGAVIQKSSGNITSTLPEDFVFDNVETIDTTGGFLDLGDSATKGYLFLHNLDSTNYIDIGLTEAAPFIKLLPGKYSLVSLKSSTAFAKANTGNCRLEYCVLS